MNFALWKAGSRLLGPGMARDVCGTHGTKRALLLYRVATFRSLRQPQVHQNMGQSRELALALSEIGYRVDVADFDERRRGLLAHDYDLVVDLHPRRDPLYAGRLRDGAVRIAYVTGNNPAFNNAEERRRLDDLARRRGVSLESRREVPPFEKEVLESFDAVFMFASRFSLATYSSIALPPVHSLPNNGYDDVAVTDPARRDPKRFLFLGSSGQVHKGLDLVLEVCARRPDLELVVCGPFRRERDFLRAYQRELFGSVNVRAVGFVDVRSSEFTDLQAECGAMILPSCSEVQCGTVTVAMSFGIPPIVSAACGFDEPEIETLPDCGIETIERTMLDWAARPREWIADRSRRTRELMMARYRPAHYAAAVRAALHSVVQAGPRSGTAPESVPR